MRLDARQHGERDGARRGVAFLDADVHAELAGLAHLRELGQVEPMPGQVKDVARLRAAGAVVLRESEGRRQLVAHLPQLRLELAAHCGLMPTALPSLRMFTTYSRANLSHSCGPMNAGVAPSVASR